MIGLDSCDYDIYLDSGIDRSLFPENQRIKLRVEEYEDNCDFYISNEDQIDLLTKNNLLEFQASFENEKQGYMYVAIEHREFPNDIAKRYKGSLYI